jgi:hypothetical protein
VRKRGRSWGRHAVRTVAEIGWKDGDLLREAERSFDVFVTIDRKIEHELDFTRFQPGFVIARVPRKAW